MNSINPYASNISQQPDFSANSSITNELLLTRVETSNQQTEDITLVTEEGDRVTISSSFQSQAVYSTYEGISQYTVSATSENLAMENTAFVLFEGETFEYENDRNFSISVDGDLNEQELKAIKKAIKTIDKIMTDILYGKNIPEALAKAAEIVNSDSIASLEANYQFEKNVYVEKSAIQETVTYSKDGLAENIEAPNNNELTIENPIDEMITAVKDSGVTPSKFKKPLNKLFANILNNLPGNDHQNKPRAHLAKFMGRNLINRINQLSKNEHINDYSFTRPYYNRFQTPRYF
jgi:hypothetical protein